LLEDRTVVRQILVNRIAGKMNSFFLGRVKVLVTHHVQLVLPAAYYIIRMLDGRIDTQGVVKELKTQGLLDEIQQDDFTQTRKEPSAQQESTELPSSSPADQQADDVKKPKKHVEASGL
jgi:ABC-type cobalamin/Fe3+-siderophores transport system ATPase subunit